MYTQHVKNDTVRLIADDKIPFLRGVPESLGFETVYLPGKDISAGDVREADALMVRTRTRCDEVLLHGSKVRLVVTATIGYDHIDTQYLAHAGIKWTNCPGCNATSVGQYVHSSLLVLAAKGYVRLEDCCVGIVGVGHVGTEVEKACRLQGCRILLNDPPREAAGEKGFTDLDALCRECDVITFHTPLTRTGDFPTYHMGNADFFASLLRRPVIINAARGEVVDNEAWVRSLDEGTTSAAVVDTWENEPDISPELLKRALIATPHVAGYSADGKANATRQALTALCRFFGISPDFEILPPPLPPDMTPEKDAALRALQLYNPLNDTAALKASPQSFEYLRGNYPLRRETWS